jgi:hypothetical protein
VAAGGGAGLAADAALKVGEHRPTGHARAPSSRAIATFTRSALDPVASVRSSSMGTSAFMLGAWKSLASRCHPLLELADDQQRVGANSLAEDDFAARRVGRDRKQVERCVCRAPRWHHQIMPRDRAAATPSPRYAAAIFLEPSTPDRAARWWPQPWPTSCRHAAFVSAFRRLYLPADLAARMGLGVYVDIPVARLELLCLRLG